jgi:RES domain-containing protein
MGLRTLRPAPAQAAFDRRVLPVTLGATLPMTPWFRLYRKAYASQFYASKGSRLTPWSGDFPCVYLAQRKETTVAEVWGDRLAAQQALEAEVYAISRAQASQWAYLRVGPLPPSLRLCDLTAAATQLAVGLDAATLFQPDLEGPQRWADCLARHPADFDGILYPSRHTGEKCLVLWQRPNSSGRLEEALKWEEEGKFVGSEEAYILAGRLGIQLAFVG